ncbi:helix-turn-helix domain-containing protein [Streptomyces adustus]|uniref:Helix-turn-helix domain-containing protein n=1 Tax=Streptomyces adustus TaxID=1609272 RepID=A0A5N8VDK8_9ACTN|nr:helix-turn-helix transcriptional regulator [Streptomyces adustus]MPY32055.1 helix-turn-helix domain-containing protein [Streptomyces adustus]
MASIHDDVAEFALLLTRLKERTDRSYAALARRVGVHASTLHRYCSAEAVPQDFAGVERFAVLCGASPEERMELHRRWVMADAARQGPRPSPARPAPAPRTSASAAASIVSAGGAASAVSARGTGPAVEAPGPNPPRSRHPEPNPAGGRRPRRRPVRSAALAASLVAVLLGLAASAAGPPSAPAPLTWTVNSHTPGLFGCGESYVVAKPPGQVPPPPYTEDIAAWAASQRAVHGGTTGVRITLQGRSSAAVVLEALHVRVTSRVTPASGRGSVYSLSDGCGAAIVPRFFSVDLDAHQPLARSRPGDNNGVGRPIPAIDFPYRVSLQEPEVLVVSSRNESCTCDWYLDLDWSSQGRTGTIRIDDRGRPFRSTSTIGMRGYRYDRVYHRPGGWVPVPAADMAATGD